MKYYWIAERRTTINNSYKPAIYSIEINLSFSRHFLPLAITSHADGISCGFSAKETVSLFNDLRLLGRLENTQKKYSLEEVVERILPKMFSGLPSRSSSSLEWKVAS